MNLTFDDEFNSLSLNEGTAATAGGTWNTSFSGWGVRTLSGNGEQEIYVDPAYPGSSGSPLGLNPFSDQNGVLTITASPTPSQDRQYLNNMPYTSGVLTTQNSFSQTYGYFEIRAELPGGGQGLWPAFWLLPENNSWPPEIDVLEQVDSPTNPVLQTTHDNSGNASNSVNVGDTSAAYHTYGVLVTSQAVTFYIDGQKQSSVPTPADYNQPMYMLLNLAVGGSWPGSPDSTTDWSKANMNVDYVRAYSLADTAMAAPNTISTSADTTAAGSGTLAASPPPPPPPPTSSSTSTSTSASSGTVANTGTVAASPPPPPPNASSTFSPPSTSTDNSTSSDNRASSFRNSRWHPASTDNSTSSDSPAWGAGNDQLPHSSAGSLTPAGGSSLSNFLASAHATISGFQIGQRAGMSGGMPGPTTVTASQGGTLLALGNGGETGGWGGGLVSADPTQLGHG